MHCLVIANKGGYILGAHSIGLDITVSTYVYVTEIIVNSYTQFCVFALDIAQPL